MDSQELCISTQVNDLLAELPPLKILVVGIGNILLANDGAGVQALQRSGPLPADIEFLDAGTTSFAISAAIETSESLVVLDAAMLGKAEPGDVLLFEGEAMDEFLTSNGQRSVHEVGLHDIMSCAPIAGRLPARRALIGIHPNYVGWGEEPTPPVARGIACACERAVELIARWRA